MPGQERTQPFFWHSPLGVMLNSTLASKILKPCSLCETPQLHWPRNSMTSYHMNPLSVPNDPRPGLCSQLSGHFTPVLVRLDLSCRDASWIPSGDSHRQIFWGWRQKCWWGGVKFNMTPNGEHQENGPVHSWCEGKILTLRHLCENPHSLCFEISRLKLLPSAFWIFRLTPVLSSSEFVLRR